MRILTAVTYYRPYTSGLTLYAERLARALVARGHEVTVLAMLHDAALAREETLDGVRVVRARPLAALSKGFVSAELPALSWRLAARHDALILHLPQFDAPLIAACGRAMRLPVIVTCHCEVTLPPGAFNRIAGASLALANRTAARLADRVVQSHYLQRLARLVQVDEETLPEHVLLGEVPVVAVEHHVLQVDFTRHAGRVPELGPSRQIFPKSSIRY